MWLVLTLASAMLLTAQWAVVRASHQKIPSSMVTAAHHLFGPILALGVLQYPLPVYEPIVLIYLLYVFAVNPPLSWLSVYAAQRIPVSLSKPLNGFSILSATLAGWLIFKQDFPPLGLIGIVLGFIGLWLLYHARGDSWKQPYPWLLILCFANFGIVSVLTSQLLAVYPHPVIVSGIGLTGALLVSGIGSLMHLKKWRVGKQAVGMLGFITLSSILGEIMSVTALGMVPAAYVVSAKRMSIIFTALLGYYLFRERQTPFWRLIVATATVTVGTILMALH